MSLLFLHRPSPPSGPSRSPTSSTRSPGFSVWPPAMSQPPRIQTTFRTRDKELPKDPSNWVDGDLLSYVRSHYPPSDSSHLRELIRAKRLTPRALWYLQTDHDALVNLAAEEELQNIVLNLALSVQPAVSPTTPRVKHVRRLSEDFADPPTPPLPSPRSLPPPEESELEEDDDVAESVVSDWALDEVPEEALETHDPHEAPAADGDPATDAATGHDATGFPGHDAGENILGLHMDGESAGESQPAAAPQPTSASDKEYLIDSEEEQPQATNSQAPNAATTSAQPVDSATGDSAAADPDTHEDVTPTEAQGASSTLQPHVQEPTEEPPSDAVKRDDPPICDGESSSFKSSGETGVRESGDPHSSSDFPGSFDTVDDDYLGEPWGRADKTEPKPEVRAHEGDPTTKGTKEPESESDRRESQREETVVPTTSVQAQPEPEPEQTTQPDDAENPLKPNAGEQQPTTGAAPGKDTSAEVGSDEAGKSGEGEPEVRDEKPPVAPVQASKPLPPPPTESPEVTRNAEESGPQQSREDRADSAEITRTSSELIVAPQSEEPSTTEQGGASPELTLRLTLPAQLPEQLQRSEESERDSNGANALSGEHTDQNVEKGDASPVPVSGTGGDKSTSSGAPPEGDADASIAALTCVTSEPSQTEPAPESESVPPTPATERPSRIPQGDDTAGGEQSGAVDKEGRKAAKKAKQAAARAAAKTAEHEASAEAAAEAKKKEQEREREREKEKEKTGSRRGPTQGRKNQGSNKKDAGKRKNTRGTTAVRKARMEYDTSKEAEDTQAGGDSNILEDEADRADEQTMALDRKADGETSAMLHCKADDETTLVADSTVDNETAGVSEAKPKGEMVAAEDELSKTIDLVAEPDGSMVRKTDDSVVATDMGGDKQTASPKEDAEDKTGDAPETSETRPSEPGQETSGEIHSLPATCSEPQDPTGSPHDSVSQEPSAPKTNTTAEQPTTSTADGSSISTSVTVSQARVPEVENGVCSDVGQTNQAAERGSDSSSSESRALINLPADNQPRPEEISETRLSSVTPSSLPVGGASGRTSDSPLAINTAFSSRAEQHNVRNTSAGAFSFHRPTPLQTVSPTTSKTPAWGAANHARKLISSFSASLTSTFASAPSTDSSPRNSSLERDVPSVRTSSPLNLSRAPQPSVLGSPSMRPSVSGVSSHPQQPEQGANLSSITLSSVQQSHQEASPEHSSPVEETTNTTSTVAATDLAQALSESCLAPEVGLSNTQLPEDTPKAEGVDALLPTHHSPSTTNDGTVGLGDAGDMVNVTTDDDVNDPDGGEKDDDEPEPLSHWVEVQQTRQAAMTARAKESDAEDSAVEKRPPPKSPKTKTPRMHLRLHELNTAGSDGDQSSPTTPTTTDAMGNENTDSGSAPPLLGMSKRQKKRNKNKPSNIPN